MSGGARPGAGRPRVTLVELVQERRFDWRSKRHRALLAGDVPDWVQARLEAAGRGQLLEAYRVATQMGDRTRAPWLAQSFEQLVREGALSE
jgi:hypothetical protein